MPGRLAPAAALIISTAALCAGQHHHGGGGRPHLHGRPNMTASCSTAIGMRHAVCVEDQMKKLQCFPSERNPHPKCPVCDHLKNPHSMWNDPHFESVLGSWGVLVGALPQGFTELAPSGVGDGEYFMCNAYEDEPASKGLSFNFWKISSFGSPDVDLVGAGEQDDAAEDAERGPSMVQHISDTLNLWTSTQRSPAAVAEAQNSHRRRLYRGYGGGASLSICVPSSCGENDVKIIAGYYYFWMKCGTNLDDGLSLSALSALNECGAKLCPARIGA
eukprot:SAG22_NODE_1654_length_3892_cov_20.221197_4_plen_273_part_01